jgi:hypothetical protein
MPRGRILLVLAALAVVAYLPTLTQPLLEDDFPNISISLQMGSPHALGQLAGSVYRLRATTEWLMCAMYHLFGMHAAWYYAVSIALHVLNTWLVYALGAWRPIGYRVSTWAAAFFAIAEGHQEAIMWISGGTELLIFLFGMAAFVCWVRFIEGGRWTYYAAALPAFLLCLLSKESAVIFAALFLLPLIFGDKHRATFLLPFLLLAAASVWLTWQSRTWSFRFHDQSFSLHAPFWLILPKNLLRVIMPWGLLASAAVIATGKYRRVAAMGFLWMIIALIPYSFLTYSTEIPSRQTYLASAGLALIIAACLLAIQEHFLRLRTPLTAAICTIVLVGNIGYLWTKKRRQFLLRAEPTQELIALARSTTGPIYVRCFPRPEIIAEEAVHLGAAQPGRPVISDAAEALRLGAVVTFCY